MTLKELSQLFYLKREIAREEERLAVLRAKAFSPSKSNIAGIHPQPGESRAERYIAEIMEIDEIIVRKLARCARERVAIERYIAEIPDSLTRQIFSLRFVAGLSWIKVARLVGGNNTDESVRKNCYRYLKKNKGQN